MCIVGDRDMAAGAVSVRLRTDEDLGALPIDAFVAHVSQIVESKTLELK
jgi:threonyl-tRNA synthetase